MSNAVPNTREIRLEFLVKLYFARRLDPDLAKRLIAEQRDTCERLEGSLASQLTALDATEPDDERAFSRMVIELRLAQTRAAIDWLTRAGTE